MDISWFTVCIDLFQTNHISYTIKGHLDVIGMQQRHGRTGLSQLNDDIHFFIPYTVTCSQPSRDVLFCGFRSEVLVQNELQLTAPHIIVTYQPLECLPPVSLAFGLKVIAVILDHKSNQISSKCV